MDAVEDLQCSKVDNRMECRDKCTNDVVNMKVCDCHKRNPRFPNLTIFRYIESSTKKYELPSGSAQCFTILVFEYLYSVSITASGSLLPETKPA